MPSPAQPTRRAVVTGLVSAAGLTLTGCSADGGSTDPAGATEPAAADPDALLVRRVRRAEADVYELVLSTRRRHRALRKPLAAVAGVHLDHVARLTTTSSVPLYSSDLPVAKDPDRALADLVAAEESLARRHAASALEARSGALARVVASMSAAAAQQASVLGAGS